MKLLPKFFILVLSLSIFSCNGQTSKNVKELDPKTFTDKIAATPNAQVVDVRTPQEFAAGHLENAINIDYLSDSFEANSQKIDKTKPVFVYCKTNNRGSKASEKLIALGCSTIYTMQGGLLKWEAEGLSKPSDKIIGMCPQEYGEMLATDKKVLVDFYAEWCAPCKQMAPYLLKMQKELADKLVIIRLNSDENPSLIKDMKILELPTLILYENKEIKWKNANYISEEDLKKVIKIN